MAVIGNIGGGGGGQGAPESVVTGSGGYTIPAGKYGYLQMASTVTWYRSGSQTNIGTGSSDILSSNSANNSAHQWVSAGTSISTSNSFPVWTKPSDGNTGAVSGSLAYARVGINGQFTCPSYAGVFGRTFDTNSFTYANSTGEANWSVSIYSE